jgi:hypothetical protein
MTTDGNGRNRMRVLIKRTVMAAALAGGILAVTSMPAFAGAPLASTPAVHESIASLQSCQGGVVYNTSLTSLYLGDTSTRVWGAGGGTLTIASGKSVTTSGSLQTTASAEAGVVFAKVSVSVGVTVGLSTTNTTTNSYSWPVPTSQNPGWIEMGHYGYQISWDKGIYQSPCKWVQTGSGTLRGSTGNFYFNHS